MITMYFSNKILLRNATKHIKLRAIQLPATSLPLSMAFITYVLNVKSVPSITVRLSVSLSSNLKVNDLTVLDSLHYYGC